MRTGSVDLNRSLGWQNQDTWRPEAHVQSKLAAYSFMTSSFSFCLPCVSLRLQEVALRGLRPYHPRVPSVMVSEAGGWLCFVFKQADQNSCVPNEHCLFQGLSLVRLSADFYLTGIAEVISGLSLWEYS